ALRSLARDFLKPPASVHRLKDPTFRLPGLGKHRHEFRRMLFKYGRRKDAAVKVRLPEVNGRPALRGWKSGLPLPNIIVPDQVCPQIDRTIFPFMQRDGLEPGQKDMAVHRIPDFWLCRIPDAIGELCLKPNPKAVSGATTHDRQLKFSVGGNSCPRI